MSDVPITSEDIFDVGATYRFQDSVRDKVGVANVALTLHVMNGRAQTMTLDQFGIGEFIITQLGIGSLISRCYLR